MLFADLEKKRASPKGNGETVRHSCGCTRYWPCKRAARMLALGLHTHLRRHLFRSLIREERREAS